MAKWIKCKECGHEFSSNISRCPNCYKWRLTAKALWGSVLGGMFCIVVVVGMILGFSDKGKISTADKQSDTDTSNVTSHKVNASSTQSYISEYKEESGKQTPANSSKGEDSTVKNSDASENTSTVTSDTEIPKNEAEIKYPIGTTIKNGFVYTTVPKFYLDYLYKNYIGDAMSFDEFAYTLLDEDKKYGYDRAFKNEDGSATKVLSWNKLQDSGAKRLSAALDFINTTKSSRFIEKIEYPAGNVEFKEFDITINITKDEMSDDQKHIIEAFGLYFLEYQYFRLNSANKCALNIKYSDNKTETIIYPDVIK